MVFGPQWPQQYWPQQPWPQQQRYPYEPYPYQPWPEQWPQQPLEEWPRPHMPGHHIPGHHAPGDHPGHPQFESWLYSPDFPPQHGFPQHPGFPGEKHCHVRVIGFPPTTQPQIFNPNPPNSVHDLHLGWKHLWLSPIHHGHSGPRGWIYVTHLDPHFDAVIGCIYVGGNHYRRVWIPRKSITSHFPFSQRDPEEGAIPE